MKVKHRPARRQPRTTSRGPLPELLKIRELAELSHESRRTIERRIANKEIRVVRLSARAVRIARDEAERYLAGETGNGRVEDSNVHPIDGGTA